MNPLMVWDCNRSLGGSISWFSRMRKTFRWILLPPRVIVRILSNDALAEDGRNQVEVVFPSVYRLGFLNFADSLN